MESGDNETTTSGSFIEEDESSSIGLVLLVTGLIAIAISLATAGGYAMWRKANARQIRVQPVRGSKEIRAEKKAAHVERLMNKSDCKSWVRRKGLTWGDRFEETFALIQRAGYVEKRKMRNVIENRLRELKEARKRSLKRRESAKRREMAIGAKLFEADLRRANDLKHLSTAWRRSIVAKDDETGEKLFDRLTRLERKLLKSRGTLNEKDLESFRDLAEREVPSFFESRIRTYQTCLDSDSVAVDEITKLTTLLDDRYKKTYDEIFKNQIRVGDAAGLREWTAFAESHRGPSRSSGTATTQSASSLVKAYVDAVHVKDQFEALLRDAAEKTNGECAFGPLKHAFRAIEKSAMKHAEDGERFNCENVLDIVRGAIVYKDMRDVTAGAAWLMDKRRSGFVVTRFKDRFSIGRETTGGWRDAMLNGYLCEDDRKHVVEIQLHHKSMRIVRSEMGGHFIYAKFRALVEAMEVCHGKMDVARRRKQTSGEIAREHSGIPDSKRYKSI